MTTTLDTTQLREGPRFLLPEVSWELYETMLSELGSRPTLRLTYDRGALELMTTSPEHEFLKKLLARLVEMMCWELEIVIRSGGSFTHKRADLKRGFEPDECYWIAHEPAVRGKLQVDLTRDPPPDLAIEIDITNSSLDRLSIYAAFGIPEVWRFDGELLRAYQLRESGAYEATETSAAFPFLDVSQLTPFLQGDDQIDEQTRLRSFVDWLRKHGPEMRE